MNCDRGGDGGVDWWEQLNITAVDWPLASSLHRHHSVLLLLLLLLPLLLLLVRLLLLLLLLLPPLLLLLPLLAAAEARAYPVLHLCCW